ncbi:MAG: signal peptidase I [Patescibacteria group bacterium]
MVKRLVGFFLESVQALVLALSVFVLLYLFVAQPNQVHGSSMFPNFHDKEFLLTEKVSYMMRDPIRGEVVVFKAPPGESCAEDECEYIKRVIGVPGDAVRVLDGQVWINGKLLPEEYLPSDFVTLAGSYVREGKPVIVPQGEYLLFGDNRSHSRDGREFGPIAKESIVGRSIFCYWPLSCLGTTLEGEYPGFSSE